MNWMFSSLSLSLSPQPAFLKATTTQKIPLPLLPYVFTCTFEHVDGTRCISSTCAFKWVHEFIVSVVNVLHCFLSAGLGHREDTFYDCITLTFVYLCIHN